MKNTARAEPNVFAQDTVGPDGAIGCNLSRRMDDGGGVEHFYMSINVTSASLTSSPSTEHTPFARPILPRDFVISISMMRVSPGRTGLRHFTLSADIK